MTLVLLTHSFPFGTGELFLDKELPFLLKEFSSITIISLFSKGTIRWLPEGVRHIALPQESKLKKLYRSLTEPATYEEWIKHPKAFYSPTTMKYLLGYMSYCSIIVEQLEKLLLEEPHLQEALFYTYWLHVHATSLALLKKRRFPKLKVVSRAHGYDIYEEEYDPPFIPMRRLTTAGLNHIYPISEDGKDTLCKKLNLNKNKLSVERLGTESPGFLTKKTASNQLSIASCSHLVKVKQVDKIIESIGLLATAYPKLNIAWNHLGGGPLYKELHALAKKHLSDRVTWQMHGNVDQHFLFEFYREHPVDVFLSTSKSEGIPVSMMEAASCGIPIIAPDVGGIREIVSADNGQLLSKNPSPAEVATALSCPLNKTKGAASLEKWKMHFSMETNYRSFAKKLASITSMDK